MPENQASPPASSTPSPQKFNSSTSIVAQHLDNSDFEDDRAFNDHEANREVDGSFFKNSINIVQPSVDRQALIAQKKDPVQFYYLHLGAIEGNFKKLNVNIFLI